MSSRTELPRPLVVAPLLVMLLAAAASQAAQAARPVIAVVSDVRPDSPQAAVGAVLEVDLGRDERFRVVDREQVRAAAQEQALQALLAPTAGPGRVALGRTLKADLLVLIAAPATDPEVADAAPPALDVVICETATGVRLASRRVPIDADKVDADAAAVQRITVEAVSRHAARASLTVVAVPAFLNNDLGYEFEPHKRAYARLVERALESRGDIVVVELAEADAIGKELTLAGNGGAAGISRPLPLYLLGEFKNAGTGPAARASLTLRTRRGERELASRSAQDLRPSETVAWLDKATADLLDASLAAKSPATRPTTQPRPEDEVRLLIERAEQYERLSDWESALSLVDAALLLEQQRPDLHRKAAALLSWRLQQVHNPEIPAIRRLPSKDPAVQAEIDRGRRLFDRAIDEMELAARGENVVASRYLPIQLRLRRWAGGIRFNAREPRRDWELAAHEQRMLLEVLRAKWKAGTSDEWPELVIGHPYIEGLPMDRTAAYLGAPPPDLRGPDKLEILKEFPDMPRGWVERFVGWKKSEKYESASEMPPLAFVEQLTVHSSPVVREVGVELLRAREAVAARENARQPTTREVRPAVRRGDADVLVSVTPVAYFDESGRPLSKRPVGIWSWYPVGERIDAACTTDGLYLMRDRERLDRVAAGNFRDGCFDGRLFWAWSFAPDAALVAVEPKSGRSWRLTGATGLPSSKNELSAAPLSPGRVFAVGAFTQTESTEMTRAWCAVVTLNLDDPAALKAGPQLKFVHEARKRPTDDWRDPEEVFKPGKPFVVSDGTSSTVVVPRVGSTRKQSVSAHPLLFDANELKARVSTEPVSLISVRLEHEGAQYWLTPKWKDSPGGLYRFGYPGPAMTRLGDGPDRYTGDRLLAHRGRVFRVNEFEWAVGDSVAGPFAPLRVWFDPDLGEQNARFGQVFASSHYGLVTFLPYAGMGGKVIEVEMRESAATRRAPASGEQPQK